MIFGKNFLTILVNLSFLSASFADGAEPPSNCTVHMDKVICQIRDNEGFPKTIQLQYVDKKNRTSVAPKLFHDNFSLVSESSDIAHGILKEFVPGPRVVDLTMGGIPVLDQGSEGTCASFAILAALEAELASVTGYFYDIDPQCSIELGNLLSPQGHNYWDGATKYDSQFLMSALLNNGIVLRGSGCTAANIVYPNTSELLPDLNTYKLGNLNQYVNLNKVAHIMVSSFKEMPFTLETVKLLLDKGHRVFSGIIMTPNTVGFPITFTNQNHVNGGLWSCKNQAYPDYDFCLHQTGAHAIVVMGYDDDQQLLKVRNSWGERVGDKGDFYMSYEYFNRMSVAILRSPGFYLYE
jgi:hypothetical protein